MKKYINALIIAATIFPATSCITDEKWSNRPDAEGAEVILRLQTPGGFAKTRSLTEQEESAIENIYVLNFDVAQGGAMTLREIKKAPVVAPDGGSFAVTITPRSGENELSRLVVLANAETIIGETTGTDIDEISDKSYDGVRKAIFGEFENKLYESDSAIPMWGEANKDGANNIKISRENKHLDVTLLRAVARIDVGVGNAERNGSVEIPWTWDGKNGNLYGTGTPIPFSLEEVYVFKANDRYAIIPDADNLTDGKASAPTVPDGTDKHSYSLSQGQFKFINRNYTNGQGLSITQQIYVPEYDIIMGGTPGDTNHKERMAIVVGGYYDSDKDQKYDDEGDKTYYRLDFAEGGDLMNVLRNHYYQFNIDKVTGPGYGSPEEAYISNPINMSCNIIDWEDGEIGDSDFGGPYKFSVSPGEFTFKAMPSNYQILNIETDYPMWTAEVLDGAGNEITWLTPTPSSGTAGVSTVEIEAEANYDIEDTRTAFIHITAGRVTLKVEVTQERLLLEGGENHILFFTDDAQYPLKVGRWETSLTDEDDALGVAQLTESDRSKLAYFKFGSVIGFDYNSAMFSAMQAAIKFNPSNLTVGTQITGYGNNSNTLPAIPGFDAADLEGSVEATPLISDPAYHNATNIANGKGDPCMLAGLSIDFIKSEVAAGRTPNSGWRLPTLEENRMFIGIAPDNNTGSFGSPYYQGSGFSAAGVGIFPLNTKREEDPRLPAAGYRDINGNSNTRGIFGFYWSSTVNRYSTGHSVYFDQNGFNPSNNSHCPNGFPVRCVRDE